MASIWVIEQGSYSDYRVVGVFASEASAKMVADHINSKRHYGDDAEVAEWPLDPGVDQLNQGMTMWFVRMAKDGAVEMCHNDVSPSYFIGGDFLAANATAHVYVWATDAAHAIKIANEKRIQALALGTWQ